MPPWRAARRARWHGRCIYADESGLEVIGMVWCLLVAIVEADLFQMLVFQGTTLVTYKLAGNVVTRMREQRGVEESSDAGRRRGRPRRMLVSLAMLAKSTPGRARLKVRGLGDNLTRLAR